MNTYAYDASGWLVQTIDALGNCTSYGYDELGRMTSMTDSRGNTWSYSYDAEGRVTSTSDALGSFTSTAYDNMGRTISRTNARNATTSYSYDEMGRTLRTTDVFGNYSRNVFDANGNLVEQYDKNGNKWEYTYDANNRMTEAVDPLGFVTTYEYDANGRSTKTVSSLDAQKLDVFEELIAQLEENNRHKNPRRMAMDSNSMYVVDDAKQREKMAAAFYRSVRREIAEYQERANHLIQTGSQSAAIMDRWIVKIEGLEQKKREYETILRRELHDIDDDFEALSYLSQELQIRARGIRLGRAA